MPKKEQELLFGNKFFHCAKFEKCPMVLILRRGTAIDVNRKHHEKKRILAWSPTQIPYRTQVCMNVKGKLTQQKSMRPPPPSQNSYHYPCMQPEWAVKRVEGGKRAPCHATNMMGYIGREGNPLVKYFIPMLIRPPCHNPGPVVFGVCGQGVYRNLEGPSFTKK